MPELTDIEKRVVRISALLASVDSCHDGAGCECAVCSAYGETVALLALLYRERTAA